MLNEKELRQLIDHAYMIARRCAKRGDPEYLSEAHAALLHALDTYRGQVPLLAWITLIVKQRISILRRKNARYLQSDETFWEALQDPHFVHPIHELLDELPPKDRLTAKLHWIDDMTILEVSKQLGEHHSITRERVNRIRRELREEVYGEG